MEDFHEARHVRALEVVGQAHVHVEVRDGVLLTRRAVLHPHRVADVLDAHAIDGQATRVGAPLHILDVRNYGSRDLGVAGRGRHVVQPEKLT